MEAITEFPLAYIAAAVTVAAGVFGFFWARGGERNQVGGIGWSALILVIAGGIVAMLQAYDQGKRTVKARADASAASRRAEALNEELRRAQFASSAAVLTLVNGFEPAQPVESANFLFEVPVRNDRTVQPAGFVGPFPELQPGGSAELLLRIDGSIYRRFGIEPGPRGGLRIRDLEDTAAPVLDLSKTGDQFGFSLNGSPTSEMTNSTWTAEPDLASPPDDMITLPPEPYVYGVQTGASGQLRRFVSQLVRQRNYGMLRVNIANLSDEQARRIIAGYEQIAPSLVVVVSTPPEREASGEPCDISRIRVPMQLREYARDGRGITLALVSDLRGFRSEPCEGGP